MKSGVTKDQVIYLLGALSIYFVSSYLARIEVTMVEAKDLKQTVAQHETRFAGYDGMIAQVTELRTEVAIIKGKISDNNEKLDRLIRRNCIGRN